MTCVSYTKLTGGVEQVDLDNYKYIIFNTAKSQITGDDVLWFGVSNSVYFSKLRQISPLDTETHEIIEHYLKDHPEKVVKFDGCCFHFPTSQK